MRIHHFIQVVAVAATFISSAASAAEWGDLTAKFILDGSPPSAKPLVINKDQQVCGNFGLVDEQLVVNPANKGIANVVVYLYQAPTPPPKAPPIHESYAAKAKEPVILDNKNCRFEPHIVALRTNQPLQVGNVDPVGHNTNITTLKNVGQNVIIPTGANMKMTFAAVESTPSPVACNIHPWMKAYVVIKDHPYVGISDKDGNLTIKNLPTGKWTFQIWQEAVGYVSEAKQNNKPVKWMRGRVEMDIKAGANDLGEIKIPVASFKLN
jgi:hypothetical protein